MVDRVIRPVRLRLLSSKMQNSLDKLNNLFIVVLVNILPDKYFKTVFSG